MLAGKRPKREAAARRATDRQILEDAGRAPRDRLERAPGQADADAVLADDRRHHYGRLLVLEGHLGVQIIALRGRLPDSSGGGQSDNHLSCQFAKENLP